MVNLPWTGQLEYGGEANNQIPSCERMEYMKGNAFFAQLVKNCCDETQDNESLQLSDLTKERKVKTIFDAEVDLQSWNVLTDITKNTIINENSLKCFGSSNSCL